MRTICTLSHEPYRSESGAPLAGQQLLEVFVADLACVLGHGCAEGLAVRFVVPKDVGAQELQVALLAWLVDGQIT